MDITQPMGNSWTIPQGGVLHTPTGYAFVPMVLEISHSQPDEDDKVSVAFTIRDENGMVVSPVVTADNQNPWQLSAVLNGEPVLLQVLKDELVYRTREKFTPEEISWFTYSLEKPLAMGKK